jgi:uncharacterized protein DUF3618
MAQRSDEIRSEIAGTREDMGATVDALAYKADVPTRTKEWLGEKKAAVTSKVGDMTPDSEQVKWRMSRAKAGVERNPIGLAVGGAAVGLIVGLLTPSTRIEDEHLGRVADEVKSSVADAGREAFDRGKQVVQEAGETAIETAKERVSEEADGLTASLQDKAHDVVSTASEADASATSEVIPRQR